MTIFKCQKGLLKKIDAHVFLTITIIYVSVYFHFDINQANKLRLLMTFNDTTQKCHFNKLLTLD